MAGIFGEDFYLYGIGRAGEINRATLEDFLKFGFDQGVCQRPLEVKDIFPKEVPGSFEV